MSHLRRNWFRRTEQSTLFVSHVPSQERRKWALSCRRRPRPGQCITHREVGCLCDGSGGPRCSGSGSNKGFVALNARLRSPGQSARDLSRSRGLARGSTLVRRHAGVRSPRLRLVQLVEGQVRHDTLSTLAVEDDLVGAAQDALHGLQIHALAGYLRRLLVFLVDAEEPGGLACRLRHGLLLVGPRGLQDTLGFAARLRNHLVGVGAGFVLQALLVGARCLHVPECVYDLGRRIDPLQLNLVDTDTGAIGIENLLHQFLYRLLGLLPRSGQKRLDVRLADDVAHGALRHLLNGDVGLLDVEEIFLRIPDAPEDYKIYVDDVLVAGEHQTFLWHRSHTPSQLT